jgi:hypothetical protein
LTLDSRGFSWGKVAVCSKHGNGSSDSVNGRKFLGQLKVMLTSDERLCHMELVR